MAADTILDRFRDLSNVASSTISDIDFTDKFEALSFKQVIQKELKVMDMTAFTLCNENNLPIIVFDMNKNVNDLMMSHADADKDKKSGKNMFPK